MKLEHQHELTYLTQCPEVNCSKTYLEETSQRLRERVLEHAGKDKRSNIVKHSIGTGRPPVLYERVSDLNKVV